MGAETNSDTVSGALASLPAKAVNLPNPIIVSDAVKASQLDTGVGNSL